MSEVIVNKVLDGIIIVSGDWSVMIDTFGFYLRSAFICSRLDSTKFKGVHFTSNGLKSSLIQLWKVSIGVYGDYSVLLILASSADWSQEKVSGTVKTCFNKALVSLGYLKSDHTEEDLSKRIFWGKTPALPYQKSRHIGELFLENLRQVKFLNVEILLQRLGQTCDFSELEKNYLVIIDKTKIRQLIIHYALDFKKENKALFFSRQKLTAYLGSPTTEFSTCLLKGYGNFYYKLGERKIANYCFVESKFYSRAFKKVNVTYSRMFEKPEISELLIDPRPHAKGFANSNKKLSLETYLNNVHTIQDRIMNIGLDKQDLSVRFETILSYNPEDIMRQNLLKDTPKMVRQVIREQDVISCIEEMDLYALRTHLLENLMPFLKTLEGCLTDKLLSELGEPYKFVPRKTATH